MISQPQTSVVIPARDTEATLSFQLEALCRQDYTGSWEVVLADNGSKDRTAEIARLWAARLPGLVVVSCPESSGVAFARNRGTEAARGDLIAFCDADDVVGPRWLSGLIEVLKLHAMATGPIDLAALNRPNQYVWRRSTGWGELPRWKGHLPVVMGCNMGVRRDVFKDLGGFDEKLVSAQDVDLAWRFHEAGHRIGFSPEAVVHWRLRTGFAFWDQARRYGQSDVVLFEKHRSHGMPRRAGRGAVRTLAAAAGVPLLAVPRLRYGWMQLAGVQTGRLQASLSRRTFYL